MNILENIDIITLQDTPEEQSLDFCPKTFDEYLGQTELKNKLAVYTQAAKMRNEPLDHMLLFGPPGLGKTTLSQIMASVMNVGIKICSGPMMERSGDLVAILTGLESRDILFIDEIHRMPSNVEEVLYNAMEHFCVDVIIGQGAGAKSVNLPIQPFTLIGATTKSGMISAPLRTRFGITERLEYYADQELADIVTQSARYLSIVIDANAAFHIGKCSRGTPRIAKKLLRRVRDFAQVKHISTISIDLTLEAFKFLGIEEGLNRIDNMLLQKIVEHFNGGPVGLETLACLIGEDSETVENVYEPYLLRKGYLEKTTRGRQIPHTKLLALKNKFLGQKTII
ncbi:MAG TPA: Holliday junction branch migration DNA helicase RuvB [Candidatus Dependentiae bacterium]|nr:Holliday junction branch migration DNA helicase RuvB [Candidatus Dependentiae bacterium]